MNGIMNNIRVNKALFVETGTYNDMALRPYMTNLTGNAVETIVEATNRGNSFSVSGLSGVAGNFLKPNTEVQSSVMIDNGWDTPRLRFILDISYSDSFGMGQRRILQGYTSHVGIGHGGAIDPSMMLYFNSVLTLRQSQITTGHGVKLATSVAEANHLLRGDAKHSLSGPQNMSYLMRPEDVFYTMGNSMMYQGGDVMDLGGTFADYPLKKSRRSNGFAPKYLRDTLRSYMTSANYETGVDILGDVDQYGEAKGQVAEDIVTKDSFFAGLGRASYTFIENGSLSYGELKEISPEIDQLAIFIPVQSVVQANPGAQVHQRGQTEHWLGSGSETIWATSLSQSVPSIMMDLMLTRVTFMATNQLIGGQHDVRIIDAKSFAEDLDLTPYMNVFIDRMLTEVLRGLTNNNLIDYSLTMTVDVLGETSINISIAGGPEVPYVTPSFADALMAPVITNSEENLRHVAYDIEQLATNLNTTMLNNNTKVGGGYDI